MTDMTPGVPNTEDTENPQPTAGLDGVDEQLINHLVSRAKTGGLQLTGEGGLLQELTTRLPESALDGEITDHLGYDKHDPASRNTGNPRNGTRSKPCSPMSDQSRSPCRATATAASSPRSWPSGRNA